MPIFVRKNLVQWSTRITPPGWCPPQPQTNPPTLPPQPATVVVKIIYPTGPPTNWRGVKPQSSAEISLTLQADGVTWLGTWDSSAAVAGIVVWTLFASGTGVGATQPVQAAAEGQFPLTANQANDF